MKILIVAPHFAPVNTPDAQRARILLPYLVKDGFDVTVLAVNSKYVQANTDPELSGTLPEHVRIVYTKAFSSHGIVAKLGVRGLALRSIYHLYREGSALLEKEHFDLVYFSTTVYLSTLLGPYWKRHFGVPYILDYHDPWVNKYYKEHNVSPPGGKLRYAFAQWLARRLEPGIVRQSSAITVVSDAYHEMLMKRYPDLIKTKIEYLPFGAPLRDFERLDALRPQRRLTKAENKVEVVYTGRVGEDILPQLRNLFEVISKLSPELRKKLHLSFWGTGYAVGRRSREVVMPLANEYGLTEICTEHPERVPYFEALQLLIDADALLVFGSEEERYSPSKVYPCLLAQKPLVIFTPEQSSLARVMRKYGITVNFEYNKERLMSLVNGHELKQELSDDIFTEKEMADQFITKIKEILK